MKIIKGLLFAFIFTVTSLFGGTDPPNFIFHNFKWGAGSTISYSYFSSENFPGKFQKTDLMISGFYSPLTGATIEAKWKASLTERSYPSYESLKTIGDLELNGYYRLIEKNNLNLWVNAGLYLFAPVKDKGTYGDTSSYLISIIFSYMYKQFTFVGSTGYFYDRRVNFIQREPDTFERIAWEEVYYTWSPFSLGIYYNTTNFSPFLILRAEKLYGSGMPAFLLTGVNLEITRNITLTPLATWKLYQKSYNGYPQKGDVVLSLQFVYHPPLSLSSEKATITTLENRAKLIVKIENVKKIDIKLNGAAPDTHEGENYTYLSLLPGKYTLSVSAEGYYKFVTEVSLNKNEEKLLSIKLNKKIVPGSILGFVTSAGVPIENAMVKLNGPVTTTVKTDREGIFKIENLPPSTYSLNVSAPEYQVSQKFVEVESGTREVVRVNLKEIEYPHAIIILRITTEKKKPVANYKYIIKAQRFKVMEQSPGLLKLKVAPGKVSIKISAPGRKEKNLQFTVEDGDEIETTVKLKKVR